MILGLLLLLLFLSFLPAASTAMIGCVAFFLRDFSLASVRHRPSLLLPDSGRTSGEKSQEC